MNDEIIKIFLMVSYADYVELVDFTIPEFNNYADKDFFVRVVYREYIKRRSKDKIIINKIINAMIKLNNYKYTTFHNFDECERFLINNFKKSYVILEDLEADDVVLVKINNNEIDWHFNNAI